jgi:hypothetical protein
MSATFEHLPRNLNYYHRPELWLPTCFVSALVMNIEEYEEAYREARDALYRRGKKVGMPTPGREGLRQCNVNGTPLTDGELFTEAWGRVLADDILSLAATQ